MLGIKLESLSWPEAEPWLAEPWTVVLPVGARTKEHGYHLPLNNDWLLAEYLTDRVLERRRVVALPTVPYGYYPAFVEYPGSVSIGRDTFRDVIVDIGLSMQRHGTRRLYVLNTGVSTNWSLEPARLRLAECGLVMEYTDILELLAPIEEQLMEQPAGTHADEIETSMTLHIAPERVQLDKAVADLPEKTGGGPFTRDAGKAGHYSPSGAWGDPTLATAAKGRRVVEAVVEGLLADIDELERADFEPAPERSRYI
jgi:creatinine amidohydrolase